MSGRRPFRRGPGGWRAAEPSSECGLPGTQPWFSTTTHAGLEGASSHASAKGWRFQPHFHKGKLTERWRVLAKVTERKNKGSWWLQEERQADLGSCQALSPNPASCGLVDVAPVGDPGP